MASMAPKSSANCLAPGEHEASCATAPNGDHGGRDANPAIAIIGMATRLSGGVQSPEELWAFIMEGKNGLCEVPTERYNIDSFYGPGRPDSVKTRKGYFLQHDPALFDAEFFDIHPIEVERMDPQQRQLLEVTMECMESAGMTDLRGSSTGCYVGVFGEDWISMASQDSQSMDRYHVSSTGQFALANRLSHQFDWHGPSMTIQTACSSSMVGLHEACQALLRNECSAAVVAGANLILNPAMTISMSDSRVLSADGACKTFDESADGYGRGEGISVVLLKRLEDALRDGDNVRSVIRGTHINHDGRTTSVGPDVRGQEDLINTAYLRAKLNDVHQTPFFECHGTGTAVGDAVEVSAITRVVRRSNFHDQEPKEITFIGSIKPNVGHTEGASGITSVIKAALSLEHDMIPPNTFFNTYSTKVSFQQGRLLVPQRPMEFPCGRKKRVSVSCFGVGGTNSHAILESLQSYLGSSRECSDGSLSADETLSSKRYLIVLSAKSQDALETRIADLINYVNRHEACSMQDLSYTLCCRRKHYAYRAFAVATSHRRLTRSDFCTAHEQVIVPIWLFTGQGAQWPGMARQLLETCPEFQEDMLYLDNALKTIPDAPDWSIIEELSKSAAQDSRVNETEVSQPLSTAVAIGLVNHLRRLHLEPAAVIGHSSGELAAAYASGAITAASAIVLAYYRGIVSKSSQAEGAMASVGLGWSDIDPFLANISDVAVACKNSPRNTVLSGNEASLEQVVNSIKKEKLQDVFCKRLRVSVAYHSSRMEKASNLYKSMVSNYIHYNDAMVPMYSTATRAKITNPTMLDPEYWRHGMASSVEFSNAVADAISEHSGSHLAFVEIGPNSTFSSFLKQIAEQMQLDESYMPQYVPTLTRNDPDSISQLLHTAGRLHCLGVDLSMSNITGPGKVIPDLPTYPWNHQRLWRESRLVHEWRHRRAPHHELLGSRLAAMPENEPTWRNLMRLGDVTWIGDHKIDGKVIFPVAGYVAMAGAACMQLHSDAVAYELRALSLTSFLVIRPGERVEILTSLRRHRYNDFAQSDWYSFIIRSHDGTSWTEHCHGQARAVNYHHPPEQDQLGALPQSYARQVNRSEWYKQTKGRGFDYGPSFRGLAEASADPVKFAAMITLDENSWQLSDVTKYAAHPTDIDQCMQLMGVASAYGLYRRLGVLHVPQSIGSLFVSTNRPSAVYVNGIDDLHRRQSWQANAVNDKGAVSLYIRELRSIALDKMVQLADSIPPLASLEWQPLIDLLPFGELLWSPGEANEIHEQHSWSRFLRLLAHAQPTLRVLEVGVASPDLTRSNLSYLKSNQGNAMFSSYTLASSSAVALDRARLEFNDDRNMSFKLLDTHSSILGQSLQPHAFDLIVTSEADHLLSPLSLSTLKQLVTPRGWLLFQEASFARERESESSIKSESEDQINGKWGESLKAAGFTLAQAQASSKRVSSNHANSEAVATAKLTLLAQAAPTPRDSIKEITLLTDCNLEALNKTFAKEFEKSGYSIQWSTLSTPPPTGRSIISLLDLNGPTLAGLTEASFERLKNYLTHGQPEHILWLTRPVQYLCGDPRYGLAHGLLRTLRHENAIDISVAELLSVDCTAINLVMQLQNWIAQFGKCSRERDFEFYVDKVVHVGRYHWMNSLPAPNDSSRRKSIPMGLHLESNGLLQTPFWTQKTEIPLNADEVEVEVRYVGLNFRDIMVALGLVGTKSQFGLEASGVVCQVGTGVDEFSIGDRVGFVGSGLCQTRVNLPSASCWKIPESVSMEVAACTLVPFLTALYSLIYAGGLTKGQSVLIHSACGGVGLAAVQVSQLVGANVYATVGSDEKAEYLTTNYLIPKDQIFHSRNESFLPKVLRATEGKGVDMVLNSLSGKLLHASWNCVAKFGKMIELGKIDFSANGSLDMGPFASNRSFVGVDLFQLPLERPELFLRLMEELSGHFSTGKLTPLPIQRIYDAPEVMDALRQMQKGQHMGKYVVRFPNSNYELPVSSDPQPPGLAPKASYILAGGLGGLGRAVSNWMAENGAGELVFISRSASSSEHEDFLHELSVQGCKTVCISGSVTNAPDVRRAIAACTFPLKGVLQLSAALHDRTFRNMTYKEWTDCLDPKVMGTWNLHKETKDCPDVEFFVIFGSLAGVYGNSGQANYAAASTYLESFVHYRRHEGLPCSLLNLGPVEDVGMVSRDIKLLQAMKAASCKLLSEGDVCRGLGMAIIHSKVPTTSQAAATESASPLSSPAIINLGLSTTAEPSEPSPRLSWTSEARFSLYANLKPVVNNKAHFVDDKFRAFVSKMEADPSILNEPLTELIICREIARLMTGYLGEDNKIEDEDIGNIAIDSLMAIEIKDWIRGNMNLDVSMDQTSRARTSGELASVTLERLKVKYGLLQ
ncbi:hypothetical protein NLG97_g3747 [Lecanicillium saksenae]|uniref:Uncharacterized protein n=1 Tax=Lecanicillium saksenae TaxID=468837 RepID=A0ACC1QX70_9HYPO|nr:hypothetical protein NLG97_g3747 [Lecanicillium saksenae]